MQLPPELLVDERLVADGAVLAVDPPERHPEPGQLALAVGSGLRLLHDSAIESGPSTGWSVLFERCRERVESGVAAGDERPPPYDRYEPERLLELVADARPGTEDLVVCHGRPTADAIWVGGTDFAGFSPPRAPIVADRHLDLAVAHTSVHRTLGAEAVYALYDAYGHDPDLVRLDHYILIAHLLGPVDPGPDRGADLSTDRGADLGADDTAERAADHEAGAPNR